MPKRMRTSSYGSMPLGTQSQSQRKAPSKRRWKAQTISNNAVSKRAYATKFYPVSMRHKFQANLGAFPTNMKIQLRIVKVFGLTTTQTTGSGFLAASQVVLNSCEPFSVSGENPMYFDTLCGGNGTSAPYEFYRVLKSNAVVEVINDNTTPATSGFVNVSVGKNLSATATDVAGAKLLMERPQSVTLPLLIASASKGAVGTTVYVNHAVALGVKDVKDDDSQDLRYDSTPASADQIRLEVAYFPSDNTVGTATTVWVKMEINQTYEFFKLNTVTES